jgi:hypothetical protein
MRRERVRRSRDANSTSQEAPGDEIAPPPGRSIPPEIGFPKDELRRVARARGVIR